VTPRVEVTVAVDDDARVRVAVVCDGRTVHVDPQFRAVEGHWVGAAISLFAARPYGADDAIAHFTDFTITTEDR
jgi:hypothetical protein